MDTITKSNSSSLYISECLWVEHVEGRRNCGFEISTEGCSVSTDSGGCSLDEESAGQGCQEEKEGRFVGRGREAGGNRRDYSKDVSFPWYVICHHEV